MKRRLSYLIVLLLLFLSSVNALAQAPSISYSSPTNVYSVGTIITNLTVTNSGGAVPATVYATVSTFAGTGATGTTNGAGTTVARFTTPRWTTFDAAGNQYVADAGNNLIRKITSAGVVSFIAGGSGTARANGAGAAASFSGPYAITFDGTNLYVADFTNNEIRKVTTAGAVTLFAGSAAGTAGSNNATGTAATFSQPAGIVYDPVNTVFYIADFANNQIRKMTTAGVVTLFAGNAGGGNGTADGTGSAASFNGPNGIAVDGSGNVYVADQNNNTIRKITPAGVVSTLAGDNTTSGSVDGVGTSATFLTPRGLDVDISGNVYVTDSGNDLIRMVTPAGAVTTIAGSGATALTNGVGTAAAFNAARGVTVDLTTGHIYISDFSNNVIRKIIGTGYSISPALPNGLTLNSTNGTISGNPTATSSATDYTITAFNASGSSSTIVNIQCVRTVDWKAGNNNTAWGTAGNWSTGAVPTANEDVRIGVVAYTNNRQPTLNATTTVHSITFGAVKAGVLTVSNTRTLTISDNLTVNTGATGTITGAGSAKVDMAPGSIININGTGTLTLTSPLDFTLKSDATGSASLGQIASGAFNGTATSAINVERYVSGGSAIYRGYRLMSSPVYAAQVGGNNVYNLDYIKASALITGAVATDGFDKAGNPTLYLFREDQAVSNSGFTSGNYWGISKINNAPTYNLYLNSIATSRQLTAGNGFLFFFRGDKTSNLANKYTVGTSAESVTFSASGTLNTGSIIVKSWYLASNLGFSNTAGNASVQGFNLVGNPYPSSINWDTFGTGITSASLSPTMYILDPVSKNYRSYTSGSGGIGSDGSTSANVIPSGQGFFVLATAASPTLTFTEAAKTSAQQPNINLYMGMPADQVVNKQYLHLQLAKDQINTDGILINFSNTVKTNKYDNSVDAPYKPGYGVVSLSSRSSDNVDLSINTVALPSKSEVIGLNVTAKVDTIYKLTLKDISGIPHLFDIWLMDAFKKDSMDMRQNKTYSFNIYTKDTASFGAKRFALVIRQNPAYAYHLLDFTANKLSNARQVQIAWKTENEENYTHFTVERSVDNGKTFDVLGGAKATAQGTYSLLDKTPVLGQNLYRLKQEDINNTISYSKPVVVLYANLSNQAIANNLSIYPNPVINNFNLDILSKTTENSSYRIRFMSSSGVIVKQVVSSQSSWQGSISNLQPGIYLIRVFNNKNDAFVGETKFVKL